MLLQTRPKHARAPRPSRSLNVVLRDIQEHLDRTVAEAVMPVAHLEKTWSPRDMTARIKKYIYSAASSDTKELRGLQWNDSVKEFVSNSMYRYGSACRRRDWFFNINLDDSFAGAAWGLLRGTGSPPCPCREAVELLAVEEYRSGVDQDRR